MNAPNTDRAFAGSIPLLYDHHLVPLIFEVYARDLANRVSQLAPSSVLELAAGTGAVTRHLASSLPADTSITATDLNQPMLDHAARVGTSRPVIWQQADATRLPFDDGTFDAVVCQFGLMFFSSKSTAFAEARRVLRPGGTLLFNVWDRIETNEFADCINQALARRFPGDPPRFLARIPYGYHTQTAIILDLAHGEFERMPSFATVAARSQAESANEVAIGYCQGTPLRSEIEARDAGGVAGTTDFVASALVDRFGPGKIDGGIQAHIVAVPR